MQVTSNLLSMMGRPWYIEPSYADSLLPMLHGLLTGEGVDMRRDDDDDLPEPKTEAVILNSDGNAIINVNPNAGDHIAILEIKQPILKYSQECGPVGTQEMMSLMQEWADNDKVKAVLLDIDSGGGSSSGTPEFAHFIKNYPKPVAVYSNGSMASAAYYLGSAADHLVMNPHADYFGSLGAYMEFLDIAGYYEKLGAKIHTIYATKSTEKNLAYREALKENYAPLRKKILDPLVEKFHADMKAFRPQLDEKVFAGDIYEPEESLSLGLTDQLGTKLDALIWLANKVEEV